MLSRVYKRYHEFLRLPLRPDALSLPYTHPLMASPPPQRLSSTALSDFRNMPPLLPRDAARATSVVSARAQRPSPFDHRVSASDSFTRLHLGSLALRPAPSSSGHSRPLIAQTPIPSTTEAYGQLLGRDFNPLAIQLLLLRTVRSCVTTFGLSLERPMVRDA